MTATFIRSGDIAQRLSISTETFRAKRQLLEDQHGFPQPMPHTRHPMLWRADQVDAWIDMQGLPRDVEERIDPALIRSRQVILLAEARRA
ncbi:hypothetical protein PARHAE_01112 [Paracoccus haematequi]|uniref:Prophage CP4-57 regulatory protein (AlpA) n=1 Tax=Paracoccus haematequi TaxID=2491866 RepID=A0A447IK76_9RHOB|nr:hypothetical protein [Paracoccus haematequi]VDS07932.1 hypothetical protein PARHAE_01112 [Paracoccus haematequi]